MCAVECYAQVRQRDDRMRVAVYEAASDCANFHAPAAYIQRICVVALRRSAKCRFVLLLFVGLNVT